LRWGLGGVRRCGFAEEARDADGFQAHARGFVLGGGLDHGQRAGHAVAPVANDPDSLRAGAEFR
jgi:hypothetical protein